MKPSEMTKTDFRRMKSGATKAVIIEMLRQNALGIDEDLEDHIAVSITRIKVGDDDDNNTRNK